MFSTKDAEKDRSGRRAANAAKIASIGPRMLGTSFIGQGSET